MADQWASTDEHSPIPLSSGSGWASTDEHSPDVGTESPDPWTDISQGKILSSLGHGMIGQGLQQAYGGVKQMFQPGAPNKYAGASQILGGAGKALTPVAIGATAGLGLPALVASPVATLASGAAGVAGGALGGWGGGAIARTGAEALGAGPEAAQLSEDVGTTVGGLAGATLGYRMGMPRIGRPTNPVQQFHNTLKPAPAEFNAQQTFETAVPEMKATEAATRTLAHPQSTPPGGTVRSAIDLADKTERRLWDMYDAKAEPWRTMGATISGDDIANAMLRAIPKDILPDVGARSLAEIEAFRGKQIPLADAEDILRKTNADLDRFEAKTPEGQRVTMQANTSDMAVMNAKARSLRDNIYSKIGDYDEGAAPREIKRRWGAVREMRAMLERKVNEATRENPNQLQAAFDLYRGGREGLLQAGVRAMSPPDTIDQGLWKAFQGFRGEPSPVEVASPWGPQQGPAVRGLLPSPTIKMGPTPDTSGPIEPTLPQTYQLGSGQPPKPQLMLPPASGATMPPRGSIQRGAGPIQSMGPITPQAPAITMDDIAQFAQKNLIPFTEAAQRLQAQGYRIQPPALPQIKVQQ